MKNGKMIIITGSPGTGKTTVSEILSKETDAEKSVYLHTDDFYHYLCKGAIPPHLPQSNEQNLIVIEAFIEAAKRFVLGGYDVIIDGIVGPWFLEPWFNVVSDGFEVHYIILRANKEVTMQRAISRTKLNEKTNTELVNVMWEQFNNLGKYETNVIDITNYSIADTVSIIKEKITNKSALLCL